jgi:hypothetical protein
MGVNRGATSQHVKRAATRHRGAVGAAARADDFGAATVDRRAGGRGASSDVLHAAVIDRSAGGDAIDLLNAPTADCRRVGEAVNELGASVERGADRDAVDELIAAAIDGSRVRRPIDELSAATVDYGLARRAVDELVAATDDRIDCDAADIDGYFAAIVYDGGDRSPVNSDGTGVLSVADRAARQDVKRAAVIDSVAEVGLAGNGDFNTSRIYGQPSHGRYRGRKAESMVLAE